MEHHTKNKGDLGVLKAQVDLYEKGYMILLPQTEHAPFDIVIYDDKEFKRVQVKYRESNERGILEVRFRSNYSTRNGPVSKKIDKNQIDVFCVYCPQTDECYYFDPKSYQQSISLRIEKTKNNQIQNVKFAKDYRKIP